MQPRWRVLAPIDLSVDPEGPVEHAIGIANAMRAELSLLHVVDPRWYKRATRLRWPANALSAAQTHCDIHRLVLPGKAGETIVHYAEHINADLLAMTSQNGGWSRFWKHSVTNEVMKSTNRPVVVTQVRSMDTAFRLNCRRILCVLNLDGTDEPVVHKAEALAKQTGGELMLLGIVPDQGLLFDTLSGLDRPLSLVNATERIRALGKGISVPHKLTVRFGWIYDCIRAAAREHAPDIVLAARPSPGRAQSQRLNMQSVSRQLSCPLLSIAGTSTAVLPIVAEPEPVPEYQVRAGASAIATNSRVILSANRQTESDDCAGQTHSASDRG